MNDGEPPIPNELDVDNLNYLIQMGDIPDFREAQNEGVASSRNILINNYFTHI